MTRLERKIRKRKMLTHIALAVVTVAVILAALVFTTADTNADAHELQPEAEQLDCETADKVVERNALEAMDDDDEAEMIEQALVEQGYLHEEIPLSFDLQCHLKTACEEFGVPYHLALGVIQAESSFQDDAQNGTCFGYMQVKMSNSDWLAESIGVTDIKDPFQNIRSGVFILSHLHANYEDWTKTLIAYNYGPGGAEKYVFSQGYTSTVYSRTVMGYAEDWLEVVGE